MFSKNSHKINREVSCRYTKKSCSSLVLGGPFLCPLSSRVWGSLMCGQEEPPFNSSKSSSWLKGWEFCFMGLEQTAELRAW